jgi:hypothetical protein
LGLACADFNGDGWPDLFIANDARANHLWINQQNGTFVDEAGLRNIAFLGSGNPAANMGVALGDMRKQGRFDVFVTHLSEELHTFWQHNEGGQFRDATAAVGLANPKWRGTGFGTMAIDFNNDGHLDLAVANGRVSRRHEANRLSIPKDLPTFWHDYAERNQLFANDGKGRFTDISVNSPAFTGMPGIYRGLAWGDVNNDGAVDLVLTQIEGPVRIFKNVAPERGHWLLVQTYDPALKRDAYGALVKIIADGQSWLGVCNPGLSYCSSGDPRVHFGLGNVTTIKEIQVQWPDGSKEMFAGGAVDRLLVLKRGEGKKAP